LSIKSSFRAWKVIFLQINLYLGENEQYF
jgi:hypothetical protein